MQRKICFSIVKNKISQYRRVDSSKNADLWPKQAIELPQPYDATDKRGKTRRKSITPERPQAERPRRWDIGYFPTRSEGESRWLFVIFLWKTIIKTLVGGLFMWNKLAYSSKTLKRGGVLHWDMMNSETSSNQRCHQPFVTLSGKELIVYVTFI